MKTIRSSSINLKIVTLSMVSVLAFAASAFSRQELNTLGNGAVVTAANWPSLIIVRSSIGDKCSGALIGPNVLLTAAHCVGKDRIAIVNGVSADCELAPNAQICPGGVDMALCMPKVGDFGNRPRYERPALDLNLIGLGQEVTLSGFGLPTLGILRIGKAKVVTRKTATGCVVVNGGASGCPGDSGSAVFVNYKGHDVLVGVISTGGAGSRQTFRSVNHADARGVSTGMATTDPPCFSKSGTGILDVTASPAADFIKDWRSRHSGAKICGLDRLPQGTCF